MEILIIEDEELASNRLEKLVRQQIPQVTILAVLDSVKSTVAWFKQNPLMNPALIFLDIHLADGNSFDIFRQVEVQVPIIFTTAYDQYALKAFEVNSVDYLLKPVTEKALSRSLEKFNKQQGKFTQVIDYQQLVERMSATARPSFQTRFMVKTGAKIKVVQVDKIAYFYSNNSLTFIKTHDGFDFMIEQTLTELEEALDTRQFYRTTRKLLVNIEAIQQIHPYFKGRVKLQLAPAFEEEVVVSSERTAGFKKWLNW